MQYLILAFIIMKKNDVITTFEKKQLQYLRYFCSSKLHPWVMWSLSRWQVAVRLFLHGDLCCIALFPLLPQKGMQDMESRKDARAVVWWSWSTLRWWWLKNASGHAMCSVIWASASFPFLDFVHHTVAERVGYNQTCDVSKVSCRVPVRFKGFMPLKRPEGIWLILYSCASYCWSVLEQENETLPATKIAIWYDESH